MKGPTDLVLVFKLLIVSMMNKNKIRAQSWEQHLGFQRGPLP